MRTAFATQTLVAAMICCTSCAPDTSTAEQVVSISQPATIVAPPQSTLQATTATRNTVRLLEWEPNPFRDPHSGLQFPIPKAWQQVDAGIRGNALAFQSPPDDSSDSYRENVFFLGVRTTTPFKLDDVVDSTLSQLRSTYSDFELGSQSSLTLGGVPARQFVYSATAEGKKSKFTQVMCVHGIDIVGLTLITKPETFDRYQPVFAEMCNRASFAK